MLASVAGSLMFAPSAGAYGEIFRWVDQGTIEMTGGNHRKLMVDGGNPNSLRFSRTSPVAIDGEWVFEADRPLTLRYFGVGGGTCRMHLEIIVSEESLGRSGTLRDHGRYTQADENAGHDSCKRRASPNEQTSGSARAARVLNAFWFEDCYLDDPGFGQNEMSNCSSDRAPYGEGIVSKTVSLQDVENSSITPGEGEAVTPEVGVGDADIFTTAGEGEGLEVPICAGGFLGNLLCPIASGMLWVMEGVSDVLQSLLSVTPLNITGTDPETGAPDPIFVIWNAVRNIANIVFVIYFLIIIFSYVTSMGISQYGVKKTLPRVLVAAILVNVSFYVVALLIDLFNILGGSIEGIFQIGIQAAAQNLQEQAGSAEAYESLTGPSALESIVVWGQLIVLVAGVVTGIIMTGNVGVFMVLVPMLIGFVLAVVSAFVLLMLRQLAILLLVILSPILVVTWLAPGTEKYFTRTMNVFIGLLMTYPIVMAVVQASILLASILAATWGTRTDMPEWVLAFVLIFVLVAGIVGVFFVIQMVLKIFNALGVGGILRATSLRNFGKGVSQRGLARTNASKRLRDRTKRLDARAEGRYNRSEIDKRRGRKGWRGAVDRTTGAQGRRQTWDQDMAVAANQEKELKHLNTEAVAKALGESAKDVEVKTATINAAKLNLENLKASGAPAEDIQVAAKDLKTAQQALETTFLSQYAGSADPSRMAAAQAAGTQAFNQLQKTERDAASVLVDSKVVPDLVKNPDAYELPDGTKPTSAEHALLGGNVSGFSDDTATRMASLDRAVQNGDSKAVRAGLDTYAYKQQLMNNGMNEDDATQKAQEFGEQAYSYVNSNHGKVRNVFMGSADETVRKNMINAEEQVIRDASGDTVDAIEQGTANQLTNKVTPAGIAATDGAGVEYYKDVMNKGMLGADGANRVRKAAGEALSNPQVTSSSKADTREALEQGFKPVEPVDDWRDDRGYL